MKELVESAFDPFGKDEPYEGQFIKFFKDRVMSKEEAEKLWVKANNINIIRMGSRPIVHKAQPLVIVGHAIVLILVGKEDE